ncbi:hypothetical protein PIB30_044016 [Stylosanthes scabra]|uniref:Uncharacterized protein n=1 Tax=Stylosanthes scabra TaxID=79078 RepID=A0ABU6XG03_9FABA|nr:hypothetical protein [Stylosanthes scabra]
METIFEETSSKMERTRRKTLGEVWLIFHVTTTSAKEVDDVSKVDDTWQRKVGEERHITAELGKRSQTGPGRVSTRVGEEDGFNDGSDTSRVGSRIRVGKTRESCLPRKALRIDEVARPGALIAGDRTVPEKSREATKMLKHSHFKRRMTARLRDSEDEVCTVGIVTRRGFQICGWFVNTINGVKIENTENDEQQ